MRVRIKLFAVAKELAGSEQLSIDVPEGATISDLMRAVVKAFPTLSKIGPHVLWAVGAEYVGLDFQIDEKSDVAMIPPVSGG